MTTYKTPDVYVEEISIFPPSVAEVETAVPCFIGYTEKAEEFGQLIKEAKKITSLAEFRQYFGEAPPAAISKVVLDATNAVSESEVASNFYMYDSLRLFFLNGGGKCYIISIGSYTDNPNKDAFNAALKKLEKLDEPTLIVFPDAVQLGDDLYAVQKNALMQCGDLMDRFTVCDLLEPKNPDNSINWEKGVSDFRNNIGMNFLKYAAAYTPWLKTNLGMKIRYRDLKGKISRSGITMDLKTLTSNKDVQDTVTRLDNTIADATTTEQNVKALAAGAGSVKLKYQALVDAFKADSTAAKMKAIFDFIYGIVDKVDLWTKAGTLKSAPLVNDIKNLIKDTLVDSMKTLIAYDKGSTYNKYEAVHPMESPLWGDIFDKDKNAAIAADASIFTGASDADKLKNALPHITKVFTQVDAALTSILNTVASSEKTDEDSLYATHVIFKNVVDTLRNSLNAMPPSGAMVGIYAMVDNLRGVWKAPANVSLNGVVGVTEYIDAKTQMDLNVDVEAGKSVNAIRPFTGKGTMVWGARTLAGNDNEWRYVPVRRFFNMVEESVKKSTYWAVFEPNDANTWIKVRAMIENYLTQKWRDGALQGSTPDKAFFVKVGLGTTMTPLDILEGRMNVEIGMAVVRPAEFIILKFSHKMPEA